jgi:hypothetical protein
VLVEDPPDLRQHAGGEPGLQDPRDLASRAEAVAFLLVEIEVQPIGAITLER